MVHDIEFKEPVFHAGLNVTVRSGTKWTKALPGDELDIFKTGDLNTRIANAKVVASVELTSLNLRNQPFPLVFEHSPRARTFAQLSEQMEAAYGEEWSEKPVVILYFWV